MDEHEKTADLLIRQHINHVGLNTGGYGPLLEGIEAALRAAAQAKAGHVRDDKGVERKVLGTLPVTKDGCVAGHVAHVFLPTSKGPKPCRMVMTCFGNPFATPPKCYSSKEAAQLARDGEGRGCPDSID